MGNLNLEIDKENKNHLTKLFELSKQVNKEYNEFKKFDKPSINCYLFALGIYQRKLDSRTKYVKFDIGYFSNNVSLKCNPQKIIDFLYKDIESLGGDIFKINQKDKLPKGYRRIAVFFADDKIVEKRDFHVYFKKESRSWLHKFKKENGTWWHKYGDIISNKDANGKIIKDPQVCNRNLISSKKGYNTFLGYYAIKINYNKVTPEYIEKCDVSSYNKYKELRDEEYEKFYDKYGRYPRR